ncbi:HAD family phosphatase [Sphingopyxis sp. JAI128]|uniref:HAD family hydrolase n=1 Tax=Sphingopyxis sp. JAI128 TaxID=2723066 RepID=UPI0016180067|nr:HAD-IB family hydrolase [Sphingopyxis sp. JAI128]MBB6427372.1 HAD superfamily hydrolase (TIGR01490 family) [Sphingopyxis sp. JAI128]
MDDPPATPILDYAHRVAMYDMDRTITRSGTYSGFLMHVARQRQQWRLLLLPLVGLAGVAWSLGLIDRSRLKAINLRLLVGKRFRRTEIAPLAESYADKVIARGLHPAALEQIAADREAGYRLLLATASFHLYVDAIARRLGMDDVLATRLDEPDGTDHIHARLAGDNCYGDAKFARISDWLAANEMTRDQMHVRAYSDHVSDHPMLRFADEAVATTPSRKLKQLAPKMGWRVVDWRARK